MEKECLSTTAFPECDSIRVQMADSEEPAGEKCAMVLPQEAIR